MHCHKVNILPAFVFLTVNGPAPVKWGIKELLTSCTFGIQGTKIGVAEVK